MKRWGIYLAAVCLVGASCLFLSQGEKASAPLPTPAAEQVPGPLKGRIILVDAGHGGYDGGARAGTSGLWEKDINLQMALALEAALKEQGAQVVMTRREDRDFASTKRADLEGRLQLAREQGAELLLSVHMNKYHDARESGPQVFYRKGQEESRLLAGCIQAVLIEHLHPKKERKALAGDYFMLSLPVPSVLVECGFLSNPEEEELLLSPDYQKKLAQAVARGVVEFVQLAP